MPAFPVPVAVGPSAPVLEIVASAAAVHIIPTAGFPSTEQASPGHNAQRMVAVIRRGCEGEGDARSIAAVVGVTRRDRLQLIAGAELDVDAAAMDGLLSLNTVGPAR